MKDEEIAAVRLELEDFVAEMFASWPRKDQTAKGSLYLRGLMLDGRRKSMGVITSSCSSLSPPHPGRWSWYGAGWRTSRLKRPPRRPEY